MSEPLTRWRVGPREGGIRLDRWLHRRIPGLSRTRIQRTIRERVTLSWTDRAAPSTPVRPGGEVRIGFVPIVEEPLDLEIPIIAEGDGWLAVNKPAGMPVHPVKSARENSLIRMLRRQTGVESLRLVHRLDRETSGALLLADNAVTARSMADCFARRTAEKVYLAVVRGELEHDEGRIERPIANAETSAVHVRLTTADEGISARTDWRVLARDDGRSLLRLEPHTGRRHQLRVHLEWLGHPILGDPLYGRPDEHFLDMVERDHDHRDDEDGPGRMLLHCAGIRLASEPPIDVDAPWPDDLRRWAPSAVDREDRVDRRS